MKIVLALLPIGILLLGSLLYRFNGRKELLKMDLVQFLYAFVIAPVMLIWVKTVIFYNLDKSVDPESKFLIDTVITALSFIFYAFIVIHSLTKTFEIKKNKDALFDLFAHSEYFHMWLSHIVFYSGILLGGIVLGSINLFIPFILINTKLSLYFAAVAGIICAIIFYNAFWNYRVAEQDKFDRLIKIQVYIYALLLITSYIVLRPDFSPEYTIYWAVSFFFVCATILTQTIKRGRNYHYKVLYHGAKYNLKKIPATIKKLKNKF